MAQLSKKITLNKNSVINKSALKMDCKLNNSNLSSSVNDLRSDKKNLITRSTDSISILEAEYIKSLQQQIYLLELENDHLRHYTPQTKNIQASVNAEPEKMSDNIRLLTRKVNDLEVELSYKDSHMIMLQSKVEILTKMMDSSHDSYEKENSTIIVENLASKNHKDKSKGELSGNNNLIKKMKDDLQRNCSNMQIAENKVELLRAQLQKERMKSRTVQSQIADKKSGVIKVDTNLMELGNNFIRNNNSFHEKIKDTLRDEILFLKHKLSEASENVLQEQLLRSQLVDDATKLMKENSMLNRQILELQNVAENEESLREKSDNGRDQDVIELNKSRDKEKEFELRVRKLRQELDCEKARVSYLVQEISKRDKVNNSRILNDTHNKNRLSDIAVRCGCLEEESIKIKMDKRNLIEHINNLQNVIQKKDKQLNERMNVMREMELRVTQLENQKSLEETFQSKKWVEMIQTIDALKSQAKHMTSVSRTRDGQVIVKKSKLRNTSNESFYN